MKKNFIRASRSSTSKNKVFRRKPLEVLFQYSKIAQTPENSYETDPIVFNPWVYLGTIHASR